MALDLASRRSGKRAHSDDPLWTLVCSKIRGHTAKFSFPQTVITDEECSHPLAAVRPVDAQHRNFADLGQPCQRPFNLSGGDLPTVYVYLVDAPADDMYSALPVQPASEPFSS